MIVVNKKPYTEKDYLMDVNYERVSQIIQAKIGGTYTAQAVRAWPLQTCARIRAIFKKEGHDLTVTYEAMSNEIGISIYKNGKNDSPDVVIAQTELEAYCVALLAIAE